MIPAFVCGMQPTRSRSVDGHISPALSPTDTAPPASNLPNVTLQVTKETYLLLRYQINHIAIQPRPTQPVIPS